MSAYCIAILDTVGARDCTCVAERIAYGLRVLIVISKHFLRLEMSVAYYLTRDEADEETSKERDLV